jgi:hypothetical protein
VSESTVPARFWAKVDKRGPDECWPWTGARFQGGYGALGVPGELRTQVAGAHRVSWDLHHGPIPDGMYVCHSCDVRECVNPAHLFLGTARDNTRDMISKGRHRTRPRVGEGHRSAKLTEVQVREIRAAKASGVSTDELMCEYPVSRRTINGIARRDTWRHLV